MIITIGELPELPTVHEMDAPPTINEVKKAIDSLKNGKAPGPNGIPGEVYKCLDEEALQRLLEVFGIC